MQLGLIQCQSRLPKIKYAVLTVSPVKMFHKEKSRKKPQAEKPSYSAVR